MRPRDRERAEHFHESLMQFASDVRPLPGVQADAARESFVEQLLESCRRVEFVERISRRQMSPLRCDPASEMFDPVRAAILYLKEGRLDEAFWMVFLFTHFGKHRESGWSLARAVYGALGAPERWSWERVSADVAGFRDWLHANQEPIKDGEPRRRFGNHRKYESLDARSDSGTGAVVQSYIDWVGPPRTHLQLIDELAKEAGRGPTDLFDALYRSLSAVRRFGRTARFDYLTMAGKVGLANIEPGLTYVAGATGPRQGAALIFGNAAISAASSTSPRPATARSSIRCS